VRDHVIVCGLGQVGFQVTSLLLDLGEPVAVVTSKAREEWIRRTRERGATVDIADARDPLSLEKAFIGSAKVLVACTASDTVNIEIALDAKRLRPDMRVIVRIFDRILAERLKSSFGIETISTAGVAGSAFSLAALGEHAISEFELGGEVMTIVKVAASEATLEGKTIAEAVHKLGFPLLLHTDAAGAVNVRPEPTAVLKAGDSLCLVAPSASLRQVHRLEADEQEIETFFHLLGRALNPFTLPRLVGSIWRNTTPELRAVFVLINVVILLSVAVFNVGMHLQAIDALYFVITTVTTVGYGDITPINAPLGIKLFACALMILGSASIAISYSIITDYIVSQRLLQLGGRRKIPHRDHVIVVGFGDVGFRASEDLVLAGAKVVVIDASGATSHLNVGQHLFPVMVGDGRDASLLKTAHLAHARAIIATTSEDAANLSVGLAAKALNPKIRAIVRINDGEFARKVTAGTPLEAAVSAEAVSAPVFVGAAMHENSLTSFLSGNRLLTVISCAESNSGAIKVKSGFVTLQSLPLKTSA
jgi:Trk K+ transport system NAD-binding subunit